MPFTFRQADVADATLVATLIAALLQELVPGYLPDLTGLTATSAKVLTMETVTGHIAYREAEPVALMMLNECAAIYAGGAFGEVTELYVRPDLRSQGLAALLIGHAIKIGREKGWARLEVGAPNQPDWARTLQFYRREGFTEVGPRLKRSI